MILAAAIAILAIAIPVLAASPGPSGAPGKSPKADKGPEVAVTVVGTVGATTDADGRPSYTITAGGKTWTLSAGPGLVLGR